MGEGTLRVLHRGGAVRAGPTRWIAQRPGGRLRTGRPHRLALPSRGAGAVRNRGGRPGTG